MPSDVEVEVWGVLIGEPKHGAWCPHCLLPSGSIIRMVAGVGDQVLTMCRHFVCSDCGIQLHLSSITLNELEGSPVELSWKERCGQNT